MGRGVFFFFLVVFLGGNMFFLEKFLAFGSLESGRGGFFSLGELFLGVVVVCFCFIFLFCVLCFFSGRIRGFE